MDFAAGSMVTNGGARTPRDSQISNRFVFALQGYEGLVGGEQYLKLAEWDSVSNIIQLVSNRHLVILFNRSCTRRFWFRKYS